MDELKKRWQVTAIIATAMIASVFIYGLVAQVIGQSGALPGSSGTKEQAQMLRLILFAVAIGDGLFSFLIKRFLLAGSAGIPANIKEDLIVIVIAQKLQVSTIVVLAFCESVAIIGLVLFLLTGNTNDFYILLGLSLMLFALHFPRFSKWQDFISEKQMSSIISQGKI